MFRENKTRNRKQFARLSGLPLLILWLFPSAGSNIKSAVLHLRSCSLGKGFLFTARNIFGDFTVLAHTHVGRMTFSLKISYQNKQLLSVSTQDVRLGSALLS